MRSLYVKEMPFKAMLKITQRCTRAVLLIAILFYGACSFGPPSDQALVSQFNKHAPHYIQLVAMLQDDPELGTIGDSFLFRTNKPYINADIAQVGITKDRLVEYKRLLTLIEVSRIDRDGQEAIIFGNWGSGFAGNTHHKGIVWAIRPLTGSERRFTLIRENWYIYQD